MTIKTAPDWCAIIATLETAGITREQVSEALGYAVTDRMLRHFASGVQPLYYRGVRLVALWTETIGRAVPELELIRGHRVDRNRESTGPRVQGLPQWPPSPPASVKPIKRGRPRKDRVEA